MKILFYIFDGFMYLLVLVMFISSIYHGVLFLFRDRRARKLLENNPTLGDDNIMIHSKRYLTSDEIANINRYKIKKGFIEIEQKTKTVKEKYEDIKDGARQLACLFGIIALGAVFQFQNWLIAFMSIMLTIYFVQISK